MDGFLYGAVIKVEREHSMEQVFGMMDKMKAIGMNTVVIWPAVYWWEDKSLPNYPYHTGHEILKYAEQIDMKIIMELAGQLTSLEYAPDFLMKNEYFAINNSGDKLVGKNFYGYLNFNHPEVKQLISKQFEEVAIQYKEYLSLYAYDIWNETQFTSFDEYTLQQFRDWLKNKYTMIDNLNDAWDRVYYDWSQIQFTLWFWASVMPMVDYNEFHKDNVGSILRWMKRAVKTVDDAHVIIADNIHSMIIMDMFYDRPQDDWNVARNVDLYGISFYPKFAARGMDAFVRHQTLTGAYSASVNGRFIISEMQTHHTTIFNAKGHVYPYELKQWNWESIAHGAKGIIYWKWNPFMKGVQTFGRGLTDLKGNYTSRGEEAASLYDIIARNKVDFTKYSPESPTVTILYDRLNHDFTKAYTLPFEAIMEFKSRIYTDSITGLYKCLWDINIPTKFITPEDVINQTDSLTNSKVLFVTNQLNMSIELAEALKEYVEKGGTLICDGKFGEVNDSGIMYNEVPGAGLAQAGGFELLDMEPDNIEMTIHDSISQTEWNLMGHHDRRIIKICNDNVEKIAEYSDKQPAIIRSKYGKGEFVYISTFIWCGYLLNGNDGVKKLLGALVEKCSPRTYQISDNALKICSLEGSGASILFIFNYYSDKKNATIKHQHITNGMYQVTDLYGGNTYLLDLSKENSAIPVEVEGNGITIYKINKLEVNQ